MDTMWKLYFYLLVFFFFPKEKSQHFSCQYFQNSSERLKTRSGYAKEKTTTSAERLGFQIAYIH